MLIFRTVLLWIAFLMLIALEFISEGSFQSGIVFRLLPSFLLIIWFVLYIAGRQKYRFKKGTGAGIARTIKVLRSIANLTVLGGALLKLGHYPYSQLLLITGIGFLAMWSSLLIAVLEEKSDYNPEIIDDILEDQKEE